MSEFQEAARRYDEAENAFMRELEMQAIRNARVNDALKDLAGMKLTEKHLKALLVLRGQIGQFVKPTDVARIAYPEKGEDWARDRGSSFMSPICKKLVEQGWVSRSKQGHYSLLKQGKEQLERWGF